MDIVINDLRQTLIELEQRLTAQDEVLAKAQAERDGTATLIEHYRAVIEHQARHVPNESPQIPHEATRLVSADELRNSIESMLATNGKPLHYRDIYSRLIASGIRVKGEDPVKNTGAHLSSDERFRSHGNGLWGLSKWVQPSPEPPLNTVPVTRPDGSIANVPISPRPLPHHARCGRADDPRR